ncbi:MULTISPECIES: biotin--[acetyl-CoA-carboxylase] ligase [Flavobacteriaceae]|uniref:biotin--[acetyl-CoA-carboxylase] ligase n=1 Tax=Flavobacteriaceae TaxID=49546 RepID=UPI001490A62E|nr:MULTISPECIES: biotin--[acetyl-CoA-carboxylase] ligase [Allomuricauda]MDC6366038.1 biotin--[acetyl-CoA-carboxylase] ligase [Muricauda sp. AC10]
MEAQSQIIKLDATDSTNLFLKDLVHAQDLKDGTVVVAKSQLKGRGQMGTVWQSESGKNLTFSILKKFNSLHIKHQFILNIGSSMAICDALRELGIPNLKVKWPNDIMSGSLKICGILIENILRGQWIDHSIIGIGLNVNQTSFEDLDKASSLKSISGSFFDLDELLAKILEKLNFHFDGIERKTVMQLLPSYEKLLFRKDKPSTFENVNGEVFMGFIREILPNGKLKLELEDQIFKEFALKEISLLY